METPATLSALSEDQGFYPEIVSSELSSESASLVIRIPSSLHFFEGHFDQFPILPGVVQVDWVYRFAQLVFNLDTPTEIDLPNIKFSSPIYPETTIHLNLEYDVQKSRLSFKYKDQEKTCSSGIIGFPA